MTDEVRLDRLLGRRVLAMNGRAVGRLEEVRVEKRGTGFVVAEYHLGPAALVERLSGHAQRLMGTKLGRRCAIPWDKLDLSDPAHPRLLCPVDDLQPVAEAVEGSAG